MSRPGFGLNPCLEDNLMLANENSSEAVRWEGTEMIQQHKMNFQLCLPLPGWTRGRAISSPSIALAHHMHAKKFLGVGPFPLCILKHNPIIERNWGILSFQPSVLEWSLVILIPASFISHSMPWNFTLKTTSYIFQHCPLELAASLSVTHSILF